MVNDFLQDLKQVGIFLIIGQTILHFRPGKQYEKYMRLMISMMIMSQLMIPIFSIFDQEIGATMNEYLAQYQEELKAFEGMQEISTEAILEMNQENYNIFLEEAQEEVGEVVKVQEEVVEEHKSEEEDMVIAIDKIEVIMGD